MSHGNYTPTSRPRARDKRPTHSLSGIFGQLAFAAMLRGQARLKKLGKQAA
jgi:hypothetical protein